MGKMQGHASPRTHGGAVIADGTAVSSSHAERERQRINKGLQRSTLEIVALHNISSPAHGTALTANMIGILKSILARRDSDAMIQACYIMDRIPQLRGMLDALENWSSYVSTAYPDDVPPIGASSWL